MQNDSGWKPLETDPTNCVTAAWRKEGELVCAEIKVDKNDGIVGVIKSNGDKRVTGELVIKDLSSLEIAFDQVGALLDGLSTQMPEALREEPAAVKRSVSVG